jgi:hypothetical protein
VGGHKESLSNGNRIKNPTDIWVRKGKQKSDGGSAQFEELPNDGNCLTGDHCQTEIGDYDPQ